MSSLETDYSPRILWRLQRGEHVMEARLVPHAQYVAAVILVNGQLRAAQAFEHQTHALRWAEEQRLINARGGFLTAVASLGPRSRVCFAVTPSVECADRRLDASHQPAATPDCTRVSLVR
jgi:hypothetical protein